MRQFSNFFNSDSFGKIFTCLFQLSGSTTGLRSIARPLISQDINGKVSFVSRIYFGRGVEIVEQCDMDSCQKHAGMTNELKVPGSLFKLQKRYQVLETALRFYSSNHGRRPWLNNMESLRWYRWARPTLQKHRRAFGPGLFVFFLVLFSCS